MHQLAMDYRLHYFVGCRERKNKIKCKTLISEKRRTTSKWKKINVKWATQCVDLFQYLFQINNRENVTIETIKLVSLLQFNNDRRSIPLWETLLVVFLVCI